MIADRARPTLQRSLKATGRQAGPTPGHWQARRAAAVMTPGNPCRSRARRSSRIMRLGLVLAMNERCTEPQAEAVSCAVRAGAQRRPGEPPAGPGLKFRVKRRRRNRWLAAACRRRSMPVPVGYAAHRGTLRLPAFSSAAGRHGDPPSSHTQSRVRIPGGRGSQTPGRRRSRSPAHPSHDHESDAPAGGPGRCLRQSRASRVSRSRPPAIQVPPGRPALIILVLPARPP
jgi:hypothetical protein